MRCRDRAALTLGPLFIRIPLALVFLWAGLGKLVADIEVGPEQAVVLSAAGVRLPNVHTPAEDDAPTLAQPLNDPGAPPADAAETDDPDGAEAPDPAPAPDEDPDAPDADTTTETPPSQARVRDRDAPRLLLAGYQDDAGTTGADDAATAAQDAAPPDDGTFKVRRVNALILLMHERAEPGVAKKDGSPTPAVWPAFLAKAPWIKVLAWAACFTEIFAGFFLLIGLLTRFSALSLAGVMGVAIWLATFGPAIQDGTAVIGFLPAFGAWSHEWSDLFFQFTLLMAALSLFFTGSGAIALDRAIFAHAPDEEDDWDEDDAPPRTLRERHSFDRSP